MAWWRRKSGPKSAKKPAIFLVSAIFLFPLPLSPPWSSATTTLITSLPTISSTIGSQHNRQPTTKSHHRFLSPLCSPSRFLLLLLLPLPQPALPLSFPSTQLLTSGRAATVTFSLFSFQPFSLLCNFFSSSSHSRLWPPSPQPTPPEPPTEPPHHVRDPHARQLPSACFASFFLGVAAACSS